MFERKKQAGKIYFLPIDQIRPSPFQARREFSEQELAALARKVQSAGLFVLAAQLFDGTARCGQFFLTGRALHGKEVSPYLYQRQAVFGQHGRRHPHPDPVQKDFADSDRLPQKRRKNCEKPVEITKYR